MGLSVLTFERGPVNVYVVLNDRSLSVMAMDVSSDVDPKPTQV